MNMTYMNVAMLRADKNVAFAKVPVLGIIKAYMGRIGGAL
jgi:hypothetical protein